MKRRITTTLAVLGLGLAACGGGSKAPATLSEDDAIDAIGDICGDLADIRAEFIDAGSDDLGDVEDAAADAQESLQEQIDLLSKLNVPDDLSGDLDDLIGGYEDILDSLADTEEAAADEDFEGVVSAIGKLQDAQSDINGVAEDLEADDCIDEEVSLPVETDPPVTDPPITDPPITDPPVTDPPTTDPAGPSGSFDVVSITGNVPPPGFEWAEAADPDGLVQEILTRSGQQGVTAIGVAFLIDPATSEEAALVALIQTDGTPISLDFAATYCIDAAVEITTPGGLLGYTCNEENGVVDFSYVPADGTAVLVSGYPGYDTVALGESLFNGGM